MATTTLQAVPISRIRRDGGTQPRASLDAGTVEEYAESLRAGAILPPVDVFFDGQDYWLADGFHRVAAFEQCGWDEIHAQIHQGDRRAAVLHSTGVNWEHGLRRSNADKRRAVETLLRDAEWGKWSDSEIARQVKVSRPLVAEIRLSCKNLQDSDASSTAAPAGERIVQVQRNGTEYAMRVGSGPVGDRPLPGPFVKPGYAPVWAIEQAVRAALAEVEREEDGRIQRLERIRERTPQGEADLGALHARAEQALKQRCAERDVRQACHNVLEQLKQALERAAVGGPAGPGQARDLREPVLTALREMAQGDERGVTALLGQIKILSPQGMAVLGKVRDRLAEFMDHAPKLAELLAVCTALWQEALGLPRPARTVVVAPAAPAGSLHGSLPAERPGAGEEPSEEPTEELRLRGAPQGQARCQVCGRPLTDPAHVAAGIGPECAGKAAAKSNSHGGAASLSGGFVFGGQQTAPAGVPELLASIERQARVISGLKGVIRQVVGALEKLVERDEEPPAELAEAIFTLSEALLVE